ncbi:MAG: MFS transporter [Betaproteobacteria bacterium]|nr:MFS transporter [Betaproteobacteria bacterium]
MDPASPPAPSTTRIFARVTLPFLAGYFVSYLFRSINAVAGPRIAAEFSLTAADLGLLSAMYFLSFALFQLPLGLLLDRYGPRRINATLLVIAAMGSFGFALSRTPGELVLARALIGIGVSGCLMAAFSAFVLWYPAERIASMNGLAFATGMLGAIATTVPLEIALRALDWREIFQGIAALALAVGLALFFCTPERGSGRQTSLREQLQGYAHIARDPAFWRVGLCVAGSQAATISLFTLWVATWERDVVHYTGAEIARALLAYALAMMAGYLGFGRAADAMARRGRDGLPLLVAGVAASSLCLGFILLGVRAGSLLLWACFFACATAVVLAYALLSRRYPKEMVGRVNTAINVLGFVGMFTGQWLVGLVLDLWPRTPLGYAPEAYTWAFGLLWLAQTAGLAWLWAGRRLFATRQAANPGA